jgi:hypothetical protein
MYPAPYPANLSGQINWSRGNSKTEVPSKKCGLHRIVKRVWHSSHIEYVRLLGESRSGCLNHASQEARKLHKMKFVRLGAK